MRTLCDKKDIRHFEGCSMRTVNRRIDEREDWPEPATGGDGTNTKLQWFSEQVIRWYEAHPGVLRHARLVVEHTLSFEIPKGTRRDKPGTIIVPPHLRNQTAKKEKEQADKLPSAA